MTLLSFAFNAQQSAESRKYRVSHDHNAPGAGLSVVCAEIGMWAHGPDGRLHFLSSIVTMTNTSLKHIECAELLWGRYLAIKHVSSFLILLTAMGVKPVEA